MIAEPAACLMGAGVTSFAYGAARIVDVVLKPLGCALIGAGLMLGLTPAHADQYKQAADNAQVECVVSSRELTRISLVGDAFASVSKITTGYPYNDFTVTNEPVRGDIYISVPESFAPRRLSFFATSKKGYVYKFACSLGGEEAEQLFVTNPALVEGQARDWEEKTSPREAAVRLIQAMANSRDVDGYRIAHVAAAPLRVGDLSVRLLAEYRGSRLTGKVLRIENRGAKPATIRTPDIAPSRTLAVSLGSSELAPNSATTMWLVEGDMSW